nr:dihydrolipoyl dehydrogenase [Sphingobium sp. 15-1]
MKEDVISGNYDVVILGSGPGGYVAAIRCAQLGLHTAIVERENLGGICLNWGCIPTKALLRSAEVYNIMKHAADYGLAAKDITADLDEVVNRSRGVADRLSRGVSFLMKKNRIAVHMGEGRLVAPGEIEVKSDQGSNILKAEHVIVATGARARGLPSAQADGHRVWTYRHALTPGEMPEDLLVIGSGAIGIEFASFYNDMGANVTVVEMMDRIMPLEDVDISDFLEKALEKQGVTVMTGARVEALDVDEEGVFAKIKDREGKVKETEFSHVIVAIGILPNTENIGLEELGVKIDRGIIEVDGFGRTNIPGIWAIGDVTAGPWLAHKASHEGVIAAEMIAYELEAEAEAPHAMDKRNIPSCTYCHPQVASVGLTEAKAREDGYSIRVGTFPFAGNGKAIALGQAEGFIKTVVDVETGELLGAHMVGAEVTELIHGYVIGRELGATDRKLAATIFPHPTLSEMLHESLLASNGRALHV